MSLACANPGQDFRIRKVVKSSGTARIHNSVKILYIALPLQPSDYKTTPSGERIYLRLQSEMAVMAVNQHWRCAGDLILRHPGHWYRLALRAYERL